MTNRRAIEIALFTTAAIILTLISIPLPFFPPFLNLDISVVMIYIVFNRQGLKAGLLSLILTMLFNLIFQGSVFFIDQITYILAFLIFYITYHYLTKKNKLLTLVTMIISLTALNYFVITPVYALAYSTQNFSTIITNYLNLITSVNYLKTILLIYPVFNLVQWGINILIINRINKNKTK